MKLQDRPLPPMARDPLSARFLMIVWVAASPTLCPSLASAQALSGRVTTPGGRPPILWGMVVAYDTKGEPIGEASWDTTGSFTIGTLDATPGRLVVEQLGMADMELPLDSLARTSGLLVTTSATPLQIHPDDLVSPSCLPLPRWPSDMHTLWRETAKMLRAVRWTARDEELRYDLEGFDRVITPSSGKVLHEETWRDAGATEVVIPDAVRLATLIEEVHDLFRSAEVSDACVRVQITATGAYELQAVGHEGLTLRVSFRADRGITALAATSPTGEAGLRVATGTRSRPFVVEMHVRSRSETPEPARANVSGVRVRSVTTTESSEQLFADHETTLITGSVFDSVTGGPLAGAVIALEGTEAWTTSDEDGAFMLAGAFDGRYDLVFGHAALDSLGFVAEPVPVDVIFGEVATTSLTVPSLASIMATRCPDTPLGPDRRVLHGVVRDTLGIPVSGGDVVATWQTIPTTLQGFAVDNHQATAVTDARGRYAICGIPLSRDVVLHAATNAGTSAFVRTRFDGHAVTLGTSLIMSDDAIARLDLTFLSSGEFGSIRGAITDDVTRRPVAGAIVTLVGTTGQRTTDEQGLFTFDAVPPGRHALAVARVGYTRIQFPFEVGEDSVSAHPSAKLTMSPGAIELAPVLVTAEGVPMAQRHLSTQGFFERQHAGRGHFAVAADIEKWSPTAVTDALRHIPGVRVRTNPTYGHGGDTRKYIVESVRRHDRLGTATRCAMAYFVDGVYAGTAADSLIDIDVMLSPGYLAGIEVYSGPSETPPRFERTGNACGVVVFWTK